MLINLLKLVKYDKKHKMFHKGIINDRNGKLFDDNPYSSCDVLKKMLDNCDKYSPNEIKDSVKEYSMENCIKESYLPVIRSVAQKQNCEL